MSYSPKLLAHYDGINKKEQLLIDHLSNTAKIAASIGEAVGIGSLCFLLGVLHDIGKADMKFQEMLKDMPGGKKSKIVHSTSGAYFLFEKEYDKKNQENKTLQAYQDFIEVCMYVIEAHHGLFDIVGMRYEDGMARPDFVNKIFERVERYKDDENYDKEEIEKFVCNEVELIVKNNSKFNSIEELIGAAFKEYSNILEIFSENYVPTQNDIERQKKGHKREERRFFDAMLIRLLLSVLKSADVKDTINAYDLVIKNRTETEEKSLNKYYIDAIEKEYKKYAENNIKNEPINQVRNKIADALLERGQQDDSGIYRLDVPTGAGKTKAALRYGLWQMTKKSKRKFIYVTAFLSILEQNAREVKKIIGEEGVLEHHSNVDVFENLEIADIKGFDENENVEYAQKSFVVDTWEEPVILTTMVQFFNTMLKEKSANLRRFSSLINSVIVIDEVQSLPIEVMYFFNLTMNFLKNVMKCNIVLCTATQPIYNHDSIKHKLQYGTAVVGEGNDDLVELSKGDKKYFDRYSVKKFRDIEVDSLENAYVSAREVAEFISKNRKKSILVVVNTKAAAANIVEKIEEEGVSAKDVYYLTTNLCPAHRGKIISKIKERLSREEKIICVSTQLIEAGVDVDFEVVMRSYAGVDSIVQAAGRCNREGKLKQKGEVILFNLDDITENTRGILGIADKKKITEDLLAQRHGKIEIDCLVEEFYSYYYSNEADGGNRMAYPLGRDQSSLFDLFVGNGIKKGDIKNENGRLRGRLKEVAEKFQLISDDTDGVFVYYEDGEKGSKSLEKLLNIVQQKFISTEDWSKINKLIRRLQPYSINIYKNNELNEFVDSYLDGAIKVLQKDHYDNRFGASNKIEAIII